MGEPAERGKAGGVSGRDRRGGGVGEVCEGRRDKDEVVDGGLVSGGGKRRVGRLCGGEAAVGGRGCAGGGGCKASGGGAERVQIDQWVWADGRDDVQLLRGVEERGRRKGRSADRRTDSEHAGVCAGRGNEDVWDRSERGVVYRGSGIGAGILEERGIDGGAVCGESVWRERGADVPDGRCGEVEEGWAAGVYRASGPAGEGEGISSGVGRDRGGAGEGGGSGAGGGGGEGGWEWGEEVGGVCGRRGGRGKSGGRRVEEAAGGEVARVHGAERDHGAGGDAADGEREDRPAGVAGTGIQGEGVEGAADAAGGDGVRADGGGVEGGASGTGRQLFRIGRALAAGHTANQSYA